MPPYRRANAPSSSDDSATARCRMSNTDATAIAMYTAMPSPTRQSMADTTRIIPPMSRTAPSAFGTTLPRSSDTDVTSPSTRWISSPGV